MRPPVELSFDAELAIIRRRLRLLAVLTCMLPILLALALAFTGLRERLRSAVHSQQTALDTYGTLYLQKKFGTLERQLASIAAATPAETLSAAQSLHVHDWSLQRYLSPTLNDAFFYDAGHDRITLNAGPRPPRDTRWLAIERPWFTALNSSIPHAVWSEPYTDEDLDQPLIAVCNKTYDRASQTASGALCLEAQLEDTLDTLVRLAEGVHGELRLERVDGSAIVHLNRPNLPTNALSNAGTLDDSALAWLARGVRLQVSLAQPDWQLKLLLPAARLRALALAELWRSLLPTLAMFLLLGGALLLLWRRYQAEQTHLSECIEALRRGQQAPEAPSALFLHGNLRQLDRLADQLHAERRESLTDAVTGALNRRAFDADLPARIQPGSGRALLIFDIDFFKQINDQFGHAVGDAVLRRLGSGFAEAALQGTLYRIGGDEFALIVETAADLAPCAEALQQIAQGTIWREREIRVALSLGGARADEGSDAQQVFERADERLYAAKRNGRARAVLP